MQFLVVSCQQESSSVVTHKPRPYGFCMGLDDLIMTDSPRKVQVEVEVEMYLRFQSRFFPLPKAVCDQQEAAPIMSPLLQ